VNVKFFFSASLEPAKKMAENIKGAFDHTLQSNNTDWILLNMYWSDAVESARKKRYVNPVICAITITAEQQVEMVRKGWLNGTHFQNSQRYWLVSREGCDILSQIALVEIRDLNNNLLTSVKSAAPPVEKVLPDITIHVPMPDWQGKTFRESSNISAFRRLFGLRQFLPEKGEVVFQKGMHGFKHRLDAVRAWLKGYKPRIPVPAMAIMHIHLPSGLANELHKKGWLTDNAAAAGNQSSEWCLNGNGLETILRRANFGVEFINDPTRAPGQPVHLWSIRKPTQW
jgi:hypothetical protein